MKETGLMFKAPLVRAILSGQKTQTRRVVNPRPMAVANGKTTPWEGSPEALARQLGAIGRKCLVGQPGDRIYVRETFAPYERDCFYRADSGSAAMGPWKPAIHMPKALARIWLEVTGVRVERLHQITDADALAEGVDRTNTSIPGYARERFRALWDSTTGRPSLPANEASKRYARVKHWLDTHPDITGWAANPWVWVIDFKTISTTGRPA